MYLFHLSKLSVLIKMRQRMNSDGSNTKCFIDEHIEIHFQYS